MATALGEFEQLILLGVLRLGADAYGVTIRRAIEEATGRDIAAGAVYTTLSRLENRGFVTASLGDAPPERSGQRRKYYRVEPEGAAALYRAYSDVRTMAEGIVPELMSLAGQAAVTKRPS